MAEFNLRPSVDRYDGHNVVSLARAASLAYKDRLDVLDRLKTWGFTQSAFLDNKSTQGFIGGRSDVILIAFRGTQTTELKDLSIDLRVSLDPAPIGKAHEGFLAGAMYVWDELNGLLESFRDQNQPIWLTGHSLGAALATVAAARLIFTENLPVEGLYTFGSPRVGDAEFAREFDKRLKTNTYRVRNNNDVVTRVPLPGLFILRYRHVGQTIYFGADGKRQDALSMWRMTVDRLYGRLTDLGSPGSDGLKDHSMDKYLSLVESDLTTV